MAYILLKVLPNYIPITTDSVTHYCDLDFMVYKCGTTPVMYSEITDFREAGENGSIHKGPRIVISAKTARQGAIKSDDALCFSADIPVPGYAYAEPEGWDCSHTYDEDTSALSFLFRPPVDGVSGFQTADIKIKSFFTTAQAGVCALQVRVENFSQFIPDVQDCTFTVVLCKKYGLEILSFEADGMQEKFFLNHNLPVTFRWNMVCDTDTDFVLLEDNCRDLKAQGFSGEKNLAQREKGDHTYTLKMILPEGDKTRSIMIRDTKWRKLENASGIAPDFSRQGHLLEFQKAVYTFYDKKVYKSSLSKDYVLAEWALFGNYDGSVVFSEGTEPVICDGKLYLIGGKKADSSRMFYAVCDLTAESCSFQEFDTGQEYGDAEIETAAACDASSGQQQWLVYAYERNHDGYIVFCVYDEQRKLFPAKYFIEAEGAAFFDIGIRNDVLYAALAAEDGIIIQKMKKGGAGFTDGGKIEANPQWMRWIRGNNNMFLLTDTGLYQGDDWINVEEQQPFRTKGSYPWCGTSGGRVVSLAASKEESGAAAVWATDTL